MVVIFIHGTYKVSINSRVIRSASGPKAHIEYGLSSTDTWQASQMWNSKDCLQLYINVFFVHLQTMFSRMLPLIRHQQNLDTCLFQVSLVSPHSNYCRGNGCRAGRLPQYQVLEYGVEISQRYILIHAQGHNIITPYLSTTFLDTSGRKWTYVWWGSWISSNTDVPFFIARVLIPERNERASIEGSVPHNFHILSGPCVPSSFGNASDASIK